MGLKSDLETHVETIFREEWTEVEAQKVPEPEDLKLGSNDAKLFKRATILYADMSGSTNLVKSFKWWFAAEIYKAFLHCAGNIIRSEGGVITSYDGDRVMAIFIGDAQTVPAARCALKINYAVRDIIGPALKKKYPTTSYTLEHVVGIDTSEIRAARTGIRGGNDIVWVGRAANYAAKLNDQSSSYPTWITADAYGYLTEDLKMGGNPKRSMWEKDTWAEMGNIDVYKSNWWWKVD